MKQSKQTSQAFTVVELLVVMAIVALLVILQLPALANTQAKVQRVYCSGNLKQVGLAFRTWAESRNGRFPMAVSPSQGASSAIGVPADGSTFSINYPFSGPRGVFGMFVVMSNELVTPKILYCPSESSPFIAPATIFGNTTVSNAGFFSDAGTSYFVGVDANENSPNMLLAGDHNLGTGINQATHVPRMTSAGTNSIWNGASSIGWQDNQHGRQGNVLFADGSVQNLDSPQFREALNKTGATPQTTVGPGGVQFSLAPGSLGPNINRLQMPRFN
jgi:prepilin-type processing-associated H-X9-DG protein